MKEMRGLVVVVMFLMLAGGVLAMDNPIRVKAGAGEEVRLFIWPAEYGPAINSDKGFANEDGFFASKIFYSLNDNNFTLQLSVFDSDGDKSSSGRFEGMNSLSPIFIDCLASECKLSSWEVGNETTENETVAVENETVENETVVEIETVIVEDDVLDIEDSKLGFTGKAIFLDEDGSIKLGYPVGGLAIMLLFVLFVIGMMHHGKKENVVVDDDDKELEYMEKKVKETEGKIKSIKDHDAKRRKLDEAKAKLASEEKELADLEKEKKEVESGAVQKDIEKQEDEIEKAEDKVEKVEEQIGEEFRHEN